MKPQNWRTLPQALNHGVFLRPPRAKPRKQTCSNFEILPSVPRENLTLRMLSVFRSLVIQNRQCIFHLHSLMRKGASQFVLNKLYTVDQSHLMSSFFQLFSKFFSTTFYIHFIYMCFSQFIGMVLNDLSNIHYTCCAYVQNSNCGVFWVLTQIKCCSCTCCSSKLFKVVMGWNVRFWNTN